ncbi:TetR/AcrR family transcriptional regulator [Streptomyces sp. NPDC004539]|uniref:TetR/AcrR family transcriptional regulator n=1 Tax=Streptomyces sp. NPDC004539 TaxID=3154280 RepID=UPI0033A04261
MPVSQDRRVLRNRAALMAAAVRLVSERGTTALPVAELSEAADVSRQLVYLQFGDRDALLVAAAADLVERELLPEVRDAAVPHETRMLAMARHFARHRPFYRALLTGSCAFPMTRAMNRLFGTLITTESLREAFEAFDEAAAADMKAFITGGTGALVNDWIVDADDPLDPEELAARLLRLTTMLSPSRRSPR